ncbi:MAG: redoxin protein [Mucilaginibacter sp.]|jgi:peroxiredoxin|nr:redoxin protein [Mucilaginibacter sp.]
MLAALNLSKYPYFDMSEIVPEPDFAFKSYQSVKPIKAGNMLPEFTLQKENAKWQQFFNGAEIHGPVLLRQLLNKPLVISFYSNLWQSYGLDLLKQLNNLQHEIKASGGNLLIISAEKEKKLEKIAWDNSLSLSFYFDTEKEIAEKFRIYSEHDPIWNRFSGIDINVPLLATYVISPSGLITYDHIDMDFAESFPTKDIISAVQRSESSNNKIRNINEAVGR